MWVLLPWEIYVWRARLVNARLENADDASLFVRVVGRDQNIGMNVVGLCAYDTPTGHMVEVMLTSEIPLPGGHGQWTSAEDMADKVMSDEAVRYRFPGVGVFNAEWMTLDGPSAAVDFWKAAPVLWDYGLGPKATYAERKGMYSGKAEDAPTITLLGKPQPLKPGDKVDDEKKDQGSASIATAVVIGTAIAAVVFLALK